MAQFISIIAPSAKLKMNIINMALSRRLDLLDVQEIPGDLLRLTFQNISSIKVMEDFNDSMLHIYKQSFKKKEKP